MGVRSSSFPALSPPTWCFELHTWLKGVHYHKLLGKSFVQQWAAIFCCTKLWWRLLCEVMLNEKVY